MNYIQNKFNQSLLYIIFMCKFIQDQMKIYYPAGIEPRTRWTGGRHATIWASTASLRLEVMKPKAIGRKVHKVFIKYRGSMCAPYFVRHTWNRRTFSYNIVACSCQSDSVPQGEELLAIWTWSLKYATPINNRNLSDQQIWDFTWWGYAPLWSRR